MLPAAGLTAHFAGQAEVGAVPQGTRGVPWVLAFVLFAPKAHLSLCPLDKHTFYFQELIQFSLSVTTPAKSSLVTSLLFQEKQLKRMNRWIAVNFYCAFMIYSFTHSLHKYLLSLYPRCEHRVKCFAHTMLIIPHHNPVSEVLFLS